MSKIKNNLESLFRICLIILCLIILIVSFRKVCNRNIEEYSSGPKWENEKKKLIKALKKKEKLKKIINETGNEHESEMLVKSMKKLLNYASKERDKSYLKKSIKVIEKKLQSSDIQNEIDKAKNKLYKRKAKVQGISQEELLKKQDYRKTMNNSVDTFYENHKDFVSSEIRGDNCRLTYGEDNGSFSFVKKGKKYKNSKDHFIKGCGFYGCKVGGLGKKGIIFEKGNEKGYSKRNNEKTYEGPESFYFTGETDDLNDVPIKYGDHVKLHSKRSDKEIRYIIKTEDKRKKGKEIHYNDNVKLKPLNNSNVEEIHILAAPNTTDTDCIQGTSYLLTSEVGAVSSE